MPAILPIKFSYLTQCDVKQLTNPQNFYFVETAVGVEGHGLARLGSNCYVTPINSKLDDCCYLEVSGPVPRDTLIEQSVYLTFLSTYIK